MVAPILQKSTVTLIFNEATMKIKFGLSPSKKVCFICFNEKFPCFFFSTLFHSKF